MNKVKIEDRTVIRVESGDYCNVSVNPKGMITLGSISLLKEELSDFLKALPEAVQKCDGGELCEPK